MIVTMVVVMMMMAVVMAVAITMISTVVITIVAVITITMAVVIMMISVVTIRSYFSTVTNEEHWLSSIFISKTHSFLTPFQVFRAAALYLLYGRASKIIGQTACSRGIYLKSIVKNM